MRFLMRTVASGCGFRKLTWVIRVDGELHAFVQELPQRQFRDMADAAQQDVAQWAHAQHRPVESHLLHQLLVVRQVDSVINPLNAQHAQRIRDVLSRALLASMGSAPQTQCFGLTVELLEQLRRKRLLAGVEADGHDLAALEARLHVGLLERGQTVCGRQMAQEAADELAGDAERGFGAFPRRAEARQDRVVCDSARDVGLRVEELFDL